MPKRWAHSVLAFAVLLVASGAVQWSHALTHLDTAPSECSVAAACDHHGDAPGDQPTDHDPDCDVCDLLATLVFTPSTGAIAAVPLLPPVHGVDMPQSPGVAWGDVVRARGPPALIAG